MRIESNESKILPRSTRTHRQASVRKNSHSLLPSPPYILSTLQPPHIPIMLQPTCHPSKTRTPSPFHHTHANIYTYIDIFAHKQVRSLWHVHAHTRTHTHTEPRHSSSVVTCAVIVAMVSKAPLCDCSACSLSASLLNISSSNRTAFLSNSSYGIMKSKKNHWCMIFLICIPGEEVKSSMRSTYLID